MSTKSKRCVGCRSFKPIEEFLVGHPNYVNKAPKYSNCLSLRNSEGKTCTKCGVYKDFGQFSRRKASKDGLNFACKACKYQETQAWRAKNPERWKEHQRNDWARHKEDCHKTQKVWREKTFAANPVAWRKKKLEELHRRKRAGEGTIPVNLKKIWERGEGICYLCFAYVPYAESSCDHIIPISRGGLHVEDNVAMVHLPCNVSKGARLPEELSLPLRGVV